MFITMLEEGTITPVAVLPTKRFRPHSVMYLQKDRQDKWEFLSSANPLFAVAASLTSSVKILLCVHEIQSTRMVKGLIRQRNVIPLVNKTSNFEDHLLL